MNCFSKSFKKSNSHCKDCGIGWNIYLVKGVMRNKPCNVVTLDNTTNSQFGTNDVLTKSKYPLSFLVTCDLLLQVINLQQTGIF